MNTFQLPDGRDFKRRLVTVRRMTLDEIKALRSGQSVLIVANDGTLRNAKINGAVRLWKRDPDRVEVPVKYGLYEYARFGTYEAIYRFVVVVDDEVES